MKHLLLFCVCLLFSPVGQAKEVRAVKKPFFFARNTRQLEVEKILLHADSTVLDIRIYGESGEEIDLVDTSYLVAAGNRYPLLSKYGFAPKGYTRIPESGWMQGRLVFKAVPADAVSLDFIENVERGWKIYDLRLDGKKPVVHVPERFQNQQLDYSRPLPAPVPEYGTIKIKGTLLGYLPAVPVAIGYRIRDWLSWEFQDRPVPVGEDGTFEVEDGVMTAGLKRLRIGTHQMELFVVPGGELNITVDLPALMLSETHLFKKEYASVRKVWFEGDYAGLNEEIYRHSYPTNPVWEWENVGTCSVKQLKKRLLNYYRKTTEELWKDKEISEPYRHWKLLELTGATFSNVTSAPYIISYSPRKKGEKRGSLKRDEHYYDEIFQLDSLFSPSMLLVSDFQSLLSTWRKHDRIPGYFQVFARDFDRTKNVRVSFSKSLPLGDPEFASLDSVETTSIREYALAKNREIVRLLEESARKTGYTVSTLDTLVAGDEILARILKPHAGKVVLIDLWATWCGPCMRAMKSMEPIKEALKGRDISYIFITNESSPEGKWKMTIPDIHGEHYRLTNEQVDYLYKTYEFPGIPAYLIADRTGKIVYHHVGFPGAEKMKEELLKALE